MFRNLGRVAAAAEEANRLEHLRQSAARRRELYADCIWSPRIASEPERDPATERKMNSRVWWEEMSWGDE